MGRVCEGGRVSEDIECKDGTFSSGGFTLRVLEVGVAVTAEEEEEGFSSSIS